ncbi:MAG: methyltransferase [Nitrospira sp.]|nr:methyltransferase [Nitrospira sp.]
MSEFDRFALSYKEVLDQDLTISGETSEYFAEYKARFMVREAVGPGFSGKVLDYGCGVGLLSEILNKHLPACTLHGFDVSSESIGKIGAGLRARGLFTAKDQDLDDDYDAIIVSNVMHHICPEDRQATICRLRSRLAPAGKLVMFEHNPLNPCTRWVVRHSPLDKEAILLPRGEALAYLRDAGLRVTRRAYIVFFPRPLAWLRALEPWLAWLPAGAQYALVAEGGPHNGDGLGGPRHS